MSELSETFRRRSQEQAQASLSLFDAEDFAGNPKKQAMAVIGQVNATTFAALAELADHLEALPQLSQQAQQFEHRQRVLQRNDAIRRAAARGDWDEFDRLAAGGNTANGEFRGENPAGGDAANGGDQAAGNDGGS